MRIVVVGGGITGLATAWHLREVAEVTVLEATPRPGGQVRTLTVAGAPLDVGADAFLARQPHGERLLRALGLGDDDLVAPATGQVHLWVRGRLRPLPSGTVLGVPGDLGALARSGVLSPAGLVRAAAEPLVRRPEAVTDQVDRSVADLVGGRFGREVVDTLVEPLLGGVYAGSAARLSAAAALGPVWEAARTGRSLTAVLRARRRATSGEEPRPVFLTVRGGLSRVVDRLRADLGGRLVVGVAAVALDDRGPSADGGRWRVVTEAGGHAADRVVLAVPARVAAPLLAPHVPAAAQELAGIRTASVATVALAYARGPGVELPAGSGVLVPRDDRWLVKAVTFASRKWPHHAGRDVLLLRASVGRVDDPRPDALDDEELARRVDAEVRRMTGLPAPATISVVQRWPDALPQYDVGHLGRVERIRRAVAAQAPGVVVAGASLDGIGLAARAAEAERMAASLPGPLDGR